MTNSTLIRQTLTSNIPELKENTIIIDKYDCIDLSQIENGVLLIYASWSVQSIINCSMTIQALYGENFVGQIILVDIDRLTPDYQIEKLGQLCHGWGEIFTINNGKILSKYLGKDSYLNYKADRERNFK